MIASKYAEFGSARVQEDMAVNHGRDFSRGFVSHLAEEVAKIAESRTDQTKYRFPDLGASTVELVVTLDELEITTSERGPGKVAIGSIGFYDESGHRQYVVYLADLFEPGSPPNRYKSIPVRFLGRMNRELQRARSILKPGGRIVGITGGDDWSTEYLENFAAVVFIDPHKAIDALSEAAQAHFDRVGLAQEREGDPQDQAKRQQRERQNWLKKVEERLQTADGIALLRKELFAWLEGINDAKREPILRARRLLVRLDQSVMMNHRDQSAWLASANAGILAESAKAVFGERLRHPKCKIGLSAAQAILILRELTRTLGRWEEFWHGVTGQDQAQEGRVF
jgi:hypothetical protein